MRTETARGACHLQFTPPDVFARAMELARRSPGIARPEQMLQKLVIFDFIVPLVREWQGGHFLEIGCGQGIHSAFLSRFGTVAATELAAPGSFIGADQDVQRARREVFAHLGAHEISFTHNDGERLPYPDATFDVVFHNSVIEHVPDVSAFNREVRRVLKPGGICICITGTPALCRFRLVKHVIFRLPVALALVFAREALPQKWTMSLADAAGRMLGLSQGRRRKIAERLQPIDAKVRQLTASLSAAAREAPPEVDMRRFHARLYHYLYFPEYNRLILDRAALECGVSSAAFLAALERHFDSWWNRTRFTLTPTTHGQHYRDVWEEMREWRIGRWREYFEREGLAVEDIRGIRYHHVLEATPSLKWNTALYHRAARLIHRAVAKRSVRPDHASEFALVARKPPEPGRAPVHHLAASSES